MSTLVLLIIIAVLLAALLAIAWGVVIRTGQSGWVDVFWAGGIGVASVAGALLPLTDGPAVSTRSWLVAILVAIWSLRLGFYILGRTLGGAVDGRYTQLRDNWGAQFNAKLLGFFEIQALAGWVLAASAMAAARNPAPLGWGDAIGVIIFLVAIGGETLSDMQMRAFKADPRNKGKVCDRGLWGLSRHPNYFFEWLSWVAYVPIGISLGYPCGYAALLAPVMMYWLLVKVSGIPPLEAQMLKSRPEAFRAYQRRVRAFWPIPKSGETA